jgi:4-hydroxybenzoate polyprenyltransferase
MQNKNALRSDAFTGETVTSRRPQSARLPSRLLSCVRWDEVLVLQGAPLIGASFSLGAWTGDNILTLAVFAVGSCCLVAHVYALNDAAISEIPIGPREPSRPRASAAASSASSRRRSWF